MQQATFYKHSFLALGQFVSMLEEENSYLSESKTEAFSDVLTAS